MITVDIRKAEKVSGAYGMFLSFPYDETVLTAVRTLPSRYWHAEDKEWEVPVNKLPDFVNQLSNYEIQIKGELGALVEKKVPNINFNFKTEPFEHQIDGFNYGLTHDKWLLGDSMGLGKTWQVINIAVAKKQIEGFKHCLIVCGVNGLKWNWVEEINKHSNEEGYILGQRVNAKGRVVVDGNAQKLASLEDVDNLPYFLITNIESLRDEKIVSAIKRLCEDGTIGMIAFDECHKAKNPTSQQGKGILKLDARVQIAMTGTPLLNTPLDLYVPLKWLGYERHSFYAFKNHYCVMGGYGNYQIMGYKNTNELRVILSEMMLRRLKEEVLDLPEKLYVNEYVEMSAEQDRIYNEILNDLRLQVDKIAESPNPLSQLIRLRQATGYTGILSSDITVSAKLDRMEDLVEEAVANGKKVVVFSNWTEMTDIALERLARFNPATITGKIKDADTEAQKERFQTDDTCKVIVGTTPKMGVGYTLTAGTIVIFLDEPWTNGDKEQALDRCHRIGTSENITIYTLLTKNTIDERVNEIVRGKGELSDALIDGKSVEDRRNLVQFLLS